MIKAAWIAFCLTSLSTPDTTQEGPPKAKPCEARRIAIADWCATCKRVLGRDDVLANPNVCKRCDEPPQKMEYCVKGFPPYFQASCHPKKKGPKPFMCCGKVHATPIVIEDRALVRYDCKSCGASAATRDVLEHKAMCSNPFGVTRICSKSGRPPHVGR